MLQKNLKRNKCKSQVWEWYTTINRWRFLTSTTCDHLDPLTGWAVCSQHFNRSILSLLANAAMWQLDLLAVSPIEPLQEVEEHRCDEALSKIQELQRSLSELCQDPHEHWCGGPTEVWFKVKLFFYTQCALWWASLNWTFLWGIDHRLYCDLGNGRPSRCLNFSVLLLRPPTKGSHSHHGVHGQQQCLALWLMLESTYCTEVPVWRYANRVMSSSRTKKHQKNLTYTIMKGKHFLKKKKKNQRKRKKMNIAKSSVWRTTGECKPSRSPASSCAMFVLLLYIKMMEQGVGL